MLFTAVAALRGISTALARYAVTGFTNLRLRVTAFNEHWNPWMLRRQIVYLSRECLRLHNAQRLGTRVVGCLSENEIHKHYMRMMGHAETPQISAEYVAAIDSSRKKDFIGGKQITRAEAMKDLPTDAECAATRAEFKRKPGNSPLHLVDGKIVCKPK